MINICTYLIDGKLRINVFTIEYIAINSCSVPPDCSAIISLEKSTNAVPSGVINNEFNFVSLGSILIQFFVMRVGVTILGRSFIWENLLVAAGILFGLIWNYTMYTHNHNTCFLPSLRRKSNPLHE